VVAEGSVEAASCEMTSSRDGVEVDGSREAKMMIRHFKKRKVKVKKVGTNS
jgi:hypothetical protein